MPSEFRLSENLRYIAPKNCSLGSDRPIAFLDRSAREFGLP